MRTLLSLTPTIHVSAAPHRWWGVGEVNNDWTA